MTGLEIYLNFNGNCQAAFDFYKQTFGGEFSIVMKYQDLPGDYSIAEQDKNKIVHISLPVGQNTLMGSDMPQDQPSNIGTNFSISYHTDTREQAESILQNLSAGGKITMPAGETFWAEFYAAFTDKFGINWMINYEGNKKQT